MRAVQVQGACVGVQFLASRRIASLPVRAVDAHFPWAMMRPVAQPGANRRGRCLGPFPGPALGIAPDGSLDGDARQLRARRIVLRGSIQDVRRRTSVCPLQGHRAGARRRTSAGPIPDQAGVEVGSGAAVAGGGVRFQVRFAGSSSSGYERSLASGSPSQAAASRRVVRLLRLRVMPAPRRA